MFDHVKQNLGKRNRQEEEDVTSSATLVTADSARPSSTRVSGQGVATIGPTIRIKGDLLGEENLIIEGQVEGTINLEKNDLTIGSAGSVKANIQAKGVIVEGQVQGDIVGKEKVVIRRTGNMRGNIVAPRVTLEDGAMFKGSIEMEPETRRGAEVESQSKSVGAPPAKDASGSTAIPSATLTSGKA